MTDELALSRLMAWLAPIFPTGGFAYSSGLESAVTLGLVDNEEDLHNWLASLLAHGRLRNDKIFLAQSAMILDDAQRLKAVNDIALASAGSAEQYLETEAQGAAFCEAARNWSDFATIELPTPIALPVAVGAFCGRANITVSAAATAYLHAFIANQLQIAIRLSVIGQKSAAMLLARLEKPIITLAQDETIRGLDNLGSTTVMAEVMTMKHELQNGRMFRS